MSNLFGNDLSAVTTENGAILNNIAKQAVSAESILTLKPDDTITAVHISPYGKSILNETSISSLRNKILDADTAIEISDNGVGEINFDVDNVLKLQVTSANTTVKNNLLVDNIKDETGNQSVNITSGQLTLQRPKITFRDTQTAFATQRGLELSGTCIYRTFILRDTQRRPVGRAYLGILKGDLWDVHIEGYSKGI